MIEMKEYMDGILGPTSMVFGLGSSQMRRVVGQEFRLMFWSEKIGLELGLKSLAPEER